MGAGHHREAFERLIIENFSILDDSAMSMVGILVDTDICDHKQSRYLSFDCSDRPLHNTVWVPSGTATLVFARWNAEKDDGRNP